MEVKLYNLGYTDIATYLLVGCKPSGSAWDERKCLEMGTLCTGGDGDHAVAFWLDADHEPSEQFDKIFACHSWLAVYNDDGLAFSTTRDEITRKYNYFEVWRDKTGEKLPIIICKKEA